MGRRMGRRVAESKPETASEVHAAADQVSPASFQNFSPTTTTHAGNDINISWTSRCNSPWSWSYAHSIKHILQLAQARRRTRSPRRRAMDCWSMAT